jgi:hypothetical protein
MATVRPAFSFHDFPSEMVAAVAVDADRDADRVISFLGHLGLRATPEKPLPMPAGFLLHLGAALRLLEWEARGIFVHREAGLPEARQAIRDAFQSLTEPDADPTKLCVAVLRLCVERFAWSGLPELGADVALDEAQEDALLEALADFLWAQRSR